MSTWHYYHGHFHPASGFETALKECIYVPLSSPTWVFYGGHSATISQPQWLFDIQRHAKPHLGRITLTFESVIYEYIRAVTGALPRTRPPRSWWHRAVRRGTWRTGPQ